DSLPNDADDIGYVNPRKPLPARPERSAHSQLERGEHLLQRAALCAQYNAGTDLNDSNAKTACGFGFVLPLATDIAHEAATSGCVFIKQLVSSISVEPYCRPAYQN